MRDEEGKKRVAIIGVASLFLVAMVIGVTIGVSKSEKGTGNNGDISATRKAVDAICQPTDYKEMCKSTLEKGAPNTDNPRDLAKAAFNAAVDEINNVTEHSLLLKELLKDPQTANATKEMGDFDMSNMDEIITNLKIWLSATITYEETCIDGFDEKNTTEAGLKVRKLLTTLMRMSSNGLAIVTGMQQVELGEDDDKQVGGPKQRRLMSWSDDFVMGHDEFVDDDLLEEMARSTHKKRRLLESSGDYSVIGHDDVIPRWLDLDDRRRKLLEDKTLDELTPNVTVAQDGSGNYTKIAEAVHQIPFKNKETFVIFIKEGIYREQVIIEKKQRNVVLIGAGPTKTTITGELSISDAGPEKHQAVAIRVQADKSIFYNCHFNGYQDTLYAHTYRQYYRDCQISGTVDFIFGDAAAFFQNCTFVVRKPLPNQQCIMLAQGRKERRQPTGISFIDDLIQPEGWMPWNVSDFGLNTSYFGEYRNEGPGSNMNERVKWGGIKTILPSRAESFMPPIFYEGDDWIKASGVPYIPALTSDSSTYIAPPGAVDEDPDNEPFASPSEVGDYDSPWAKKDSESKKSKHKFSKDSGDKSDDSSKETSDDSSKDSGDKSDEDSKGWTLESLVYSPPAMAPSPEPLPSQDLSTIYQTPVGVNSISEAPTIWDLGVPSESPSIDSMPPSELLPSDDLSISSMTPGASMSEAPSHDFDVLSGSPSSMADLEIPPTQINQDETSDGSLSENPSLAINNNRTVIQVSMEEVGEIPSSSPNEGPMAMTLDEPPTSKSPSSVINLEESLTEEEAPTNAPSESPSSYANLERMLMQEEASTDLESESPSPMYNLENASVQEEPAISVSPSSFVNIEKVLMQEEASTTLESDPETAPMQEEPPISQEEASTYKTSESPSLMVNLERKLMQDVNLERMLMQEETPTITPSKSPSSMVNLEPNSMEEEPPISTPSESPLLTVNLERTLMLEEPPATTPSESSSLSVVNLENSMENEPPTSTPSESPSLMSNLKRMMKQEEFPTSTPSESQEPPTFTPSESPLLMLNFDQELTQEENLKPPSSESPSSMLKKMLMQEESPASAPSESPSIMDDLKRMLIQDDNDSFDDASDDNDDHDKLVTSNKVRMDKVLESLHLKTREDLSLDEVMMRIPDPHVTQSPKSIAMAPEIKKIGRNLLQSVSMKEGQANVASANNDPNNRDAALAQLASSPQSKTFMGNGASMSAAPEAGEFFKQLGLDTTSLPNTPPGSNAKSDTSGGCKTGFRFRVIAVMIIVLFV
ncbi:hypothetical protein V2J09_007851 [Rumex salicifolius]